MNRTEQRKRAKPVITCFSHACIWQLLFLSFAFAPSQIQGQKSLRAHLVVDRAAIVTASVNGQPVQFCLDTGLGGPAIISKAMADKLRLPNIGSTTLSDPSGNGGISVSTTRLDSIEIGGARFFSTEAAIQPDGPMTNDCGGVLGLDFFKGHLVTIDLRQKELRLDETPLSASESGVLAYTLDHGIPEIEMEVGHSLQLAHIDTMGRGLRLPESAIRKLHLATQPSVVGRGRTISGDFEITGAVVDDFIMIGPYSFKGSFVEFDSHFPVANIGLAAFANFRPPFRSRQASGAVRLNRAQHPDSRPAHRTRAKRVVLRKHQAGIATDPPIPR